MANFRIETPVKGASTDLGSIHFHLGVAEVDEIPLGIRQYCEQYGYPITDLREQAEPETDGVPDDDGDPLTPPRGNASADAWREHLLAVGASEADVDGLTRDQLKELADKIAQDGAQA